MIASEQPVSAAGSTNRLTTLKILLTALVMLNLLLWPSSWVNSHAYILSIVLSIVAILICPNTLVLNKGTRILSLLAAIFCLLHFCGFFYANNPSLVWTKSFNWLFLVVTLFFAPSLFTQVKAHYWKRLFMAVVLINCIFIWVALLYAIFFSSETVGFSSVQSRAAASYFNKNDNHISVLLALQLPIVFVLRREQFISRNLLYPLVGSIVGAVVMLSSRAVLLSSLLGIAVMIAMEIKQPKKIIDLIPKLILSILGISIFLRLVLKDWETFIFKLNPFRFSGDYGFDERTTLWQKTWSLFAENPILGVGSGNWITEVWKFGLGDLGHSKNRGTIYTHAHNYYLEVLSETGLMGGIIFGLIICYAVYLAWQAQDAIARHLLVAIGLYCLMSGFYGISYTHTEIHSPLQWIFIAYLALLAYRSKVLGVLSYKKTYLLKTIAIAALIISGSWAIYLHNKTHDFLDYNRGSRREKPAIALQKITKIYQHGYFQYYRNKNLKSYVAREYWRMGNGLQAVQSMLQSLQESPNDFIELRRLGSWYEQVGERERSYQTYLRAFEINNRNHSLCLTLAEYALERRDWDVFEKALGFYEEDILPWLEKHGDRDYSKLSAIENNTYRSVKKKRQEVLKLRKKRNQDEG